MILSNFSLKRLINDWIEVTFLSLDFEIPNDDDDDDNDDDDDDDCDDDDELSALDVKPSELKTEEQDLKLANENDEAGKKTSNMAE